MPEITMQATKATQAKFLTSERDREAALRTEADVAPESAPKTESGRKPLFGR